MLVQFRGESRAIGRLRALVGAKTDPAHMLHATGDHDVVDAALDRQRGEVDRLLARAAAHVHRRRAGLLRQALLQPRRPRHAARLLADLMRAARDDIVDTGRIELRPRQHLHEDAAEQIGRMDVAERPLLGMSPPDRRAASLDDHRCALGLPHILSSIGEPRSSRSRRRRSPSRCRSRSRTAATRDSRPAGRSRPCRPYARPGSCGRACATSPDH
jgi:hypothetical protein